MFKSYIFSYCIEIKYDSKFFSDTKLDEIKILHIEVFNQSGMILMNIVLNFIIKPKNRIDLKILKNPNHKDLSKKLEWERINRKDVRKIEFFYSIGNKRPFYRK